ncbi:MAG: histidine kinase dimerization/phospho-acceptor domain-containing protein [Gemmatimonadota bacterium]
MSTHEHRSVPVEVRAARLEVVSRLADDLAHEIKNPLNAVVINLAVLRTRVQKGDCQGSVERADVVEREVLRAHELIDRLLRLVRPAADEPIEQQAAAVLADVLPLLALQARLARVELRVEEPADGETLLARPATLRAALLALGGDAITATAGAGEDAPLLLRCAAHGAEFGFWVHAPVQDAAGDTAGVLAAAAGGRLEARAGEAEATRSRVLLVPRLRA